MTEELTTADLVQQILNASGATANRDVLRDILRSAAGLASDDADRLDLKITAAALKEMRAAFAMFGPLEGLPKVTVFGSARTRADDPLYAQAQALARLLAHDGWMVITGAGPGIMQAAAEGAGRDHAIGEEEPALVGPARVRRRDAVRARDGLSRDGREARTQLRASVAHGRAVEIGARGRCGR